MISKSHTYSEIFAAHKAGKMIFRFDTGTSGEDDILIMEPGQVLSAIKGDLLVHHDLNEFPEAWSLIEMDIDDVKSLLQDKPYVYVVTGYSSGLEGWTSETLSTALVEPLGELGFEVLHMPNQIGGGGVCGDPDENLTHKANHMVERIIEAGPKN